MESTTPCSVALAGIAARLALRLRAIAPPKPQGVLSDALWDLESIALCPGEWTADTAAWAIETAAEASSDATADGWADEYCLAIAEGAMAFRSE